MPRIYKNVNDTKLDTRDFDLSLMKHCYDDTKMWFYFTNTDFGVYQCLLNREQLIDLRDSITSFIGDADPNILVSGNI